MIIHTVVIYILLLFLIIGVIDKALGNRRGYGKAFDEGFQAMGPLALVMVGMISIAPVLAESLKPIVTPIFSFLGADPAMFPGMLLAIDMGGYSLAIELAEDERAGLFSGIIMSTMLGPTFVFTVPVALGLISKNDYPILAKGIMIGLIPIPAGAFIAGLVAGYAPTFLILQLLPVLIFIVVIIAGLFWLKNFMIQLFVIAGRVIMVLVSSIIAVVAVQELSDITIIAGLTPFQDSMEIVGLIVLTLAGAFPLVHFLRTKVIPLCSEYIKKIGLTELTVVGLISSLAHSIPMFKKIHEMEEQGKLINIAFSVSGAFVLGGHLGFSAAVEAEMVLPMMIGKISAGVMAVIIAYIITKKSNGKIRTPLL
ncbi:ethanolamine utilization protein EutH [Salipaludibacillus neizhouensis]|uniref:ethanolamine utilization protein EutH n=1 Tax=Salipaludibacillus neizhouensis TaxID=885475 RepID=UPI001601DD63|nr:ethanolamine utilization protein EutH [Salipaludibacillus neizhouensis]